MNIGLHHILYSTARCAYIGLQSKILHYIVVILIVTLNYTQATTIRYRIWPHVSSRPMSFRGPFLMNSPACCNFAKVDHKVKLKRQSRDKFLMGNLIIELQGVTCHMGSHDVLATRHKRTHPACNSTEYSQFSLGSRVKPYASSPRVLS